MILKLMDRLAPFKGKTPAMDRDLVHPEKQVYGKITATPTNKKRKQKLPFGPYPAFRDKIGASPLHGHGQRTSHLEEKGKQTIPIVPKKQSLAEALPANTGHSQAPNGQNPA